MMSRDLTQMHLENIKLEKGTLNLWDINSATNAISHKNCQAQFFYPIISHGDISVSVCISNQIQPHYSKYNGWASPVAI